MRNEKLENDERKFIETLKKQPNLLQNYLKKSLKNPQFLETRQKI